jgi:predicted MFS family arabinose efflux permease
MEVVGAHRRVVAIMAFSTGAVVANIYYAQPLVETLATTFHASAGAIGLLITLTQLGYAAGLATLVPLGDLVERRRLLMVLLGGCVLGLTLMATAPTLAVICSAAVLVGLTSVAVQVIVPFAAQLAREGEQGRVVGSVMSGLLIGILLSRTVSGVLAGAIGWRWVFGIAAIFTALVAVVLWRELPVHQPTTRLRYPALLASVLRLVAEEPVLRYRMACGALAMASFSALWSTIGFLLARPPYRWTEVGIGLFALLGVAGAMGARFAGRLADRGHARWASIGFAALASVSFLPTGFGAHSVIALAIGVVLLDLGIQGLQIINQSLIYPLRADARSRVNTAYMTTYFIGGSLGSAAATVLYGRSGWVGVCWLGAVFPALACLLMVFEWLVRRRRAEPAAMEDRRSEQPVAGRQ